MLLSDGVQRRLSSGGLLGCVPGLWFGIWSFSPDTAEPVYLRCFHGRHFYTIPDTIMSISLKCSALSQSSSSIRVPQLFCLAVRLHLTIGGRSGQINGNHISNETSILLAYCRETIEKLVPH